MTVMEKEVASLKLLDHHEHLGFSPYRVREDLWRAIFSCTGPKEWPTQHVRDEDTNSTRESQEERWDGKFYQLLFYKQNFGHCNVPLRARHNSSLATWVNWQREARKQQRISEVRAHRLTELGFQWDWNEVKTSLWLLRFFELIKFRQNFGHCNVPRRWNAVKLGALPTLLLLLLPVNSATD
jgi:hypothetical protein